MLSLVIPITIAVAGLAPAAKQRPVNAPDLTIVVFRHHPGIIDKQEVMKAREADAVVLCAVAQEHCGSSRYEGGLGRGFELSIPVRDLAQWKTAVDKLMKDGKLKVYDRWSLNHDGYGLIPIR